MIWTWAISLTPYSTTWLPTLLKVVGFDNPLLDHVGLPNVLVFAVRLVNIFGWMGKGDYSKTFLAPTRSPRRGDLEQRKDSTTGIMVTLK